MLQEVAAARDIQTWCGNAQIDGQAFCLGLDVLRDTCIKAEGRVGHEKSPDDGDENLDSDDESFNSDNDSFGNNNDSDGESLKSH